MLLFEMETLILTFIAILKCVLLVKYSVLYAISDIE